jgi:dTDP-4-amino-4,6-dideoxygalactose transaminase
VTSTTAREKVAFVDLIAQYASIKQEIDHAIQSVIDRAAFIGGPFVADFEREFAAFCGAARAVGASSGTSALHLGLQALGVGPGDEVITVPNTFIATVETIVQTGARPVFVDVDDETLNLDPGKLEQAITGRTKAIVPVHLYGRIADMAAILDIAGRRGLSVLEDAAQAHGAELAGRRAGTFGAAATYSFYPGKILGAFGDAGVVVTNSEDLAARMERLANHGRLDRYHHAESGYNYRLDGIQAAILSVKLRHLEGWIQKRKEKARLYGRLLSGSDVRTPVETAGQRHVHTYYVIRTRRRQAVQSALAEAGVDAIIHYPVPLHLQPAFEHLDYGRGCFPVAERAAEEILSLPLYPELPDATIERIAACVQGAAG